MSARAIVSGALAKAPELRTSRNGNAFAVLALRENAGGSTRWWNAVAFDEAAIEALKSLAVGEPVGVCGEIDAELWAPEGREPRITWRIVIENVLTVRRKPKHASGREVATASGGSSSEDGCAAAAGRRVDG